MADIISKLVQNMADDKATGLDELKVEHIKLPSDYNVYLIQQAHQPFH